MKKIILSAIVLLASSPLFAQTVKVGPYNFTKVVENQWTPIKDQNRSGTCWAYSGIAAIESDIIKHKGDKFKNIDLSEMWVARNSYYDKFVKYVRLHGELNFAEGGAFCDVIDVFEKYGIVPQDAYQGLNYGYDAPVFGELWEALKGYANGIIKNKDKKLSTSWKAGFDGILDAYFGKRPEKFMYEGKEYTPKSFAKYLDFKKSDYISICSFTHVPYGEMHVIEVPDNWLWGSSLNVSLEDFVALHDEALMNGYTSAWGADVSEKGFSHSKGLCVLPATKADEVSGSERAKWETLSPEQKKAADNQPAIEKNVTPENRQEEYDNYLTTDDHGMQIVGMYKDQNDNIFYKVKNSWNTNNVCQGFFYASQTYFKAKTLNYLIHKNSLSKKTRAKYGIK